MENKYNEATPLRPDGDRVLNADVVQLNLNQSIAQIRNETSWKDSDRNSITLFKSDSLRIVLMGLHKNAELTTHTAKGMISVQILEGRINFTAQNRQMILEQTQMIALHENIEHSILALKETFFLLTMVIK